MHTELIHLLTWAEQQTPKMPYALVTLVEIAGSVPQRVGARIVVLLDGRQEGTVGGGNLEFRLAGLAREMLQKRQSACAVTLNLASDLGMACGGRVVALLEPFGNRHPVLIYGAGHVCRALVPLLVGIEFDVTVVDDRPEWADPAAFPEGVNVVCGDPVGHAESASDLSATRVLVMTRGHEFDFGLVKTLLPRAPLYLGVMASKSKRHAFQLKLEEAGIKVEQHPNLFMPVGLSIGSRTPAEIGVSIAGQLIQHRFERS